jgi:hypothetical protein
MDKRVTQLAALPLALALSGCSGLLSWDGDQSHNTINETPRLAATSSPSQDEPGSQLYLHKQHKENSEKHTKAAYPDIKQHMIDTKGNHHEHTNQYSGREEVMSISLHNDDSLISRDNLNFLVLGSIAVLLLITTTLQWIFRCKGV